MKKITTSDVALIGKKIEADQVVVFAFVDEMVQATAWGFTAHRQEQADKWADLRFNDIVAGAIRTPSNERVRKRCGQTKDMFA